MLTLALLLAAPAAAEHFQSTVMLDTIVEQFTGKRVGEVGGARTPVDSRLKLAACAAPQLEWRSEAKDAVVVRCMQPGWRIFVPVNAVPQPKSATAPAAPVKAAPTVKMDEKKPPIQAVAIEGGRAKLPGWGD